jgi:hypothetical protein
MKQYVACLIFCGNVRSKDDRKGMRDGGKAVEVGRELINEGQEGVKGLKKKFPC